MKKTNKVIKQFIRTFKYQVSILLQNKTFKTERNVQNRVTIRSA
ncbi:MAG: hypothetical protein AB1521_06095 [Bacteroidota bacterium]